MPGDNRALGVTGVTWMDAQDELGKGQKSLAEIVAEVTKYHERRLGVPPNLIQVHPKVVDRPALVNDVWVDPQRHILVLHFHAVCVPENKLPSPVEPEPEVEDTPADPPENIS